jgi:hypothetical protein
MIVMPANSTGWFWHCLARETGRIGHLFSPGAQLAKPFPWFPYALDNGAFACWNMEANEFNELQWAEVLPKWRKMLAWAASAIDKPRWAIVPDTPGDAKATLQKWSEYVGEVRAFGFPLAIAVQDGMTIYDVQSLDQQPDVICVGGTDMFKWGSIMMWRAHFPRVHVLRCNSPDKLYWLEQLGIESCDGTGWNRGNRRQTAGLEIWARSKAVPRCDEMHNYVCKTPKGRQQEWAF